MKKKISLLGAALFAVGACFWSGQAFAQTTTSVTTTKGAFTEYVPGSETMVVRTETAPSPLRYSVTKQTTIVDETGAPVSIERLSPGSPVSIQYTGTGEHLVASRIVVQKSTTAVAPVTTGAAVTEQQTTRSTTAVAPVTSGAAVTEQQATRSTTAIAPVTSGAAVTEQQTTTTTTRALTHDEKHALHEKREAEKKAAKKQIEREKEALEKAKDKLDDD